MTAEDLDRRAKIMATLGPATNSEDALTELFEAGVDVVRLNLSLGTHESHRQLIHRVRRVAETQKRHVPIVLDLMGPRYRLGEMDGKRELQKGSTVRFGLSGSGAEVPISRDVLEFLQPGERLLVDNGLIELTVEEKHDDAVTVRVNTGGAVSSRKGINLPDTDLPFEVSAKDSGDIGFGVDEGVDYVAASYVGTAEDVRTVREAVREAGGEIPLIAKLERSRAMEHLDEIVEAADALMVARGDLGVEVPMPRVPIFQKRIIGAGREAGKPVIVATQMLESMIEQPRPTRAEATDVANAVFDGADALMLSGETAAGRFPVEAVGTMADIICEAESWRRGEASTVSTRFPLERARARELGHTRDPDRHAASEEFDLPDTVSAAAVHVTGRIPVRFLVAFSQGGFTARLIARYRPAAPILVFTNEARVARQVQLLWGVRPLVLEQDVEHHDQVVALVERELKRRGLVQEGDTLVILMGDPIPERPLTNLLRMHRVKA